MDNTADANNATQESIQELFNRAVADGVMTNDEHEQLMTRMHKDGEIDAEESALISKLFSLIREGKLRIVDSEREAADVLRDREKEKSSQTNE